MTVLSFFPPSLSQCVQTHYIHTDLHTYPPLTPFPQIMASQKTLPMAMTVLSFFPPSLGEPGLIAIPCIVTHLTQIFMDAFIVAKWASTSETKPPRALLRDRGRFRCLKKVPIERVGVGTSEEAVVVVV